MRPYRPDREPRGAVANIGLKHDGIIVGEQQKRAANAQYRMCLSQCLLNNKAGRGFANGLNGMAQCNTSCAPLKYGGTVVPPSWERNQRRLKTIDCTITQMSRNQATARCNDF